MEYMGNTYLEAVRALTEVGAKAAAKGLVSASGGNLSARLGDSNFCVITGTGAWLEDLRPEDFAVLDIRDGSQIGGSVAPSSEYKVHTMTYMGRPDVGSVVHLHPQWTVLAGAVDVTVRPFSLDQYSYLGDIRDTPFSANGSDQLGIDVAAAAEAGSDVILMAYHGCVCLGGDARMGYRRALNLEEAARLSVLAQLAGRSDAGFPDLDAATHH